jgi:hypothetical protein
MQRLSFVNLCTDVYNLKLEGLVEVVSMFLVYLWIHYLSILLSTLFYSHRFDTITSDAAYLVFRLW